MNILGRSVVRRLMTLSLTLALSACGGWSGPQGEPARSLFSPGA